MTNIFLALVVAFTAVASVMLGMVIVGLFQREHYNVDVTKQVNIKKTVFEY